MTPLTAAASAPTGGSASLLLLAAIIAVGYTIACMIWPFKACRRCRGAGGLASPTRRAFRTCPHCHGAGARLRTGRRIWTYLTRTRHNADHHHD